MRIRSREKEKEEQGCRGEKEKKEPGYTAVERREKNKMK